MMKQSQQLLALFFEEKQFIIQVSGELWKAFNAAQLSRE